MTTKLQEWFEKSKALDSVKAGSKIRIDNGTTVHRVAARMQAHVCGCPETFLVLEGGHGEVSIDRVSEVLEG